MSTDKKVARAEGRADAPYLFVMVSQPSEGMKAWFWRQLHTAGILKTECRIVYLIDEPPAGANNKPLKSQVRSARERFEQDVRRSSPRIVVPMARSRSTCSPASTRESSMRAGT